MQASVWNRTDWPGHAAAHYIPRLPGGCSDHKDTSLAPLLPATRSTHDLILFPFCCLYLGLSRKTGSPHALFDSAHVNTFLSEITGVGLRLSRGVDYILQPTLLVF